MAANRKIAILGAGRIGESLLAGLLSSGWRKPGDIVVTGRCVDSAVTLGPLMLPTLAASGLIVFVLAISDFAVPALLRTRVYTTEVFTAFAAFYDFTRAAVVALPLIAVATLASHPAVELVAAADVYTNPQHAGRGGWTWYTGSAGWMYRLIIESLLGLRLEGDVLRIAPCIPADWPGYVVRYRYRDTVYRIQVRQSDAVDASRELSVDGVVQQGFAIPLRNDHAQHEVEVRLPVTALV